MRFRIFILLLLSLQICDVASQIISSNLIRISTEDYDNYLLRDDTTSAQLLFTSDNASSLVKSRFLVAFPAGDSGASLYFISANKQAKKVSISLVEGTLKSISAPDNHFGVSGQWKLDQDSNIDAAIMGSARAVRDFDEAGTLHEDFKSSRIQPSASSVSYLRFFIADSVTMKMAIESTSGKTIKIVNGHVQLPEGTYDFSVTLNITSSLKPLSAEKLLRSERQSMIKDEATALNIQSLAFLAYNEKLLAGGWRYLTYFGRDTMISVRLLLPLLSSDAVEAALSSVFERAKADDGQLCHEETIGDYAAWLNKKQRHSDWGSKPIYDYTMVDTNFELLPLLAAYFLDESTGQGRAKQFLARTTASGLTYAQVLDKNVNLVLAQAADFAKNPTWKNLVQLKKNESTGNWRDSESGIGWGRIPFDVNVALVPSALLAIERLADAQIITPTSQKTLAAEYRKVWESKAAALFHVPLVASETEKSLNDYLSNLGLPASLLTAEGNDKSLGLDEFYALSLRTDGQPIRVMHSDFSFNLMYDQAMSEDFMRYVARVLQPFPRGLLMEGVGMLIANPVYDTNRTNWDIFGRTAYHGTCVWAFQQSMVALGLDRQLNFCKNESSAPSWCKDSTLVGSLKEAQCRLWATIEANTEADLAETWSWTYDKTTNKFIVTDPLDLNKDATEPDAVQLWSFTLMAAKKPDYCTSGAALGFSPSNLLYLVLGSLCFLVFTLFCS